MIGRQSELQRIKNALRKPEPLLVLGPAGSGKTELIRAAIGDSTTVNRSYIFDTLPASTVS